MPANPSNPGGDDNYGDAAMPEAASADTAAPQEAGDSASTGLLPREFFQGKDLTPGTKCEIEVVKVHDDQAEVRYMPHEENAEPAGDDATGGGAAPQTADMYG